MNPKRKAGEAQSGRFEAVCATLFRPTLAEAVSDIESLATTNRVNPVLYLYGTHYDKKPWRVTFDIMKFIDLMNHCHSRS